MSYYEISVSKILEYVRPLEVDTRLDERGMMLNQPRWYARIEIPLIADLLKHLY